MAGAYAKIEGHEDICAVRYASLESSISELKDGARTTNRLIIGALLALVGWMGVTLWNGQVAQHPAQAVAVAVK